MSDPPSRQWPRRRQVRGPPPHRPRRHGLGLGRAPREPRAPASPSSSSTRSTPRARRPRSRFVTEARAAATIQSKHAIQIYDHGVTDDGRPYMVMELLTGEPLDKRIDALGRISLQETARILGQVSPAPCSAHTSAGIIHRDLKPENIFLVRSPGRRRRDRQGPRLRHREDQGGARASGADEQHEDRRRPRHAVLHVARASARACATSTTARTSGRSASSPTSA